MNNTVEQNQEMSSQERISGGIRLDLNPDLFTQSDTDNSGIFSSRLLPENSALMTQPRMAISTSIILNLDLGRINNELKRLSPSEIDYHWPQGMAWAATASSREIFDREWNSPEEDEAWRDM